MRSAAFTLALLVLAGALLPSAAAVVVPERPTGTHAQVGQQSRIDDPAATDILVRLRDNQSARWTVSVTYRLDSEEERAAFDTYAESFENGSATAGLNPSLFRTLAQEASESTGRQMRIRNVALDAASGDESGTLSLSFTWTNFLERGPGGTLRFHDAVLLASPMPESQTWLATLEANQTMVIRTPPGYSVNTTEAPSFEFQNNSVVIEGPQEFNGDLTIVYQQTTRPENDVPWTLVGAAIVAAAVVAAALLLRRRGASDDASGMTESTSAGDEPPPDASPAPEPSADGAVESESTAEDEQEVDLSLLSDEERVEHLLERNGGRMKQANIVRETGWSDAKVSQLLSSMADEGRVEKLRLGRENLISLPDEADDE